MASVAEVAQETSGRRFCECGKPLHHRGRCRAAVSLTQRPARKVVGDGDVLAIEAVDRIEYLRKHGGRHKPANPVYSEIWRKLLALPMTQALVLRVKEGLTPTVFRARMCNTLNRYAVSSESKFVVRGQANNQRKEVVVWKVPTS